MHDETNIKEPADIDAIKHRPQPTARTTRQSEGEDRV